jgi:hypothetical protein
MTGGIFISYRRDDARHAAGRLADDLGEHFDPACIFRDVDGIDPGVDFVHALELALESCVVMLVLIGDEWLGVRDGDGRQRLARGDDWVRLEIASALRRRIRVVPVLLEGAVLPTEDDLPEELRPLCRRQALELSDRRWPADLQHLVRTLAAVPGMERLAAAPPRRERRRFAHRPLWLGACIGAAGLVGAAALLTGALPPRGRTPAVQPAHALASADAPVIDMQGVWRSDSGERFRVMQDGRRLRVTTELNGQDMGSGRGELEGTALRLALSVQARPGASFERLNCQLRAAADGRSFEGFCLGPDGPFASRIFR